MSHNNRDPMNPENRPENPGMITSSSSDDGNNSSGDGDSDEAEGQQQRSNFKKQHHHKAEKKPAARAASKNTTYKDYSRVPPDTTTTSPSASLASQGNNSGNVTRDPTFVVKLHMILSNSKFEEIVTWLPHGRSWRILRPKDFEEQVIPLYFRHGRYSSFMRQVNGKSSNWLLYSVLCKQD